MTSLLLAGYLSTLHRCKDFDCALLKRFKNQDCTVQVNEGVASVFGTSYPLRLAVDGNVLIYTGSNGNLSLSLHFRRDGKIIRAYVSEYSDKHNYRRWKCDFPGMEHQPGW